jgi:hypothetical protein
MQISPRNQNCKQKIPDFMKKTHFLPAIGTCFIHQQSISPLPWGMNYPKAVQKLL